MSYKILISQPIMAVKVAYDSPIIPLLKKVSWLEMLYKLTEQQGKPWSYSTLQCGIQPFSESCSTNATSIFSYGKIEQLYESYKMLIS